MSILIEDDQNVPHHAAKKPIIISRVEHSNEDVEELSKMAEQGVAESVSEEIFSNYVCHSLPKDYGAIKHPGDIVEAGSLAAQRLPNATYNLNDALPVEMLQQGKLSDLQIEGILYAIQRHQTVLPNGTRAGFFIGDGAGVGKGRQIAGIVLDNFCRGRCKHVWFSVSNDLCTDAKRDISDLDAFINVIDGCQRLDKETRYPTLGLRTVKPVYNSQLREVDKLTIIDRAFGLNSEFQDGVVFSTYATLVSSFGGSIFAKKQSRLDQIISWCGGKEFDGCLIFDECHKAKNFIPGKEKLSTKVANAVAAIQRLLPLARVVYCSATGVTDLKNMAYMERLGLWGHGTSFKDFEKFHDSITKRGLGALEMLAVEMKASGMYVSRGLSYKQTEFVTVESDLTESQSKVWNNSVRLWNELRRTLLIAIGRTKINNSNIWRQFWGSHQRFFKQMCMSMKIPKIVEESKSALENNCCVVIGLQTTGEASLVHEMNTNGKHKQGFVSLTKEMVSRFIDIHFPTEIQLNPRETKPDEWCIKAKETLKGFCEKIKFPNNPLDELIDLLGGPNAVAEMTGRHGRIVRDSPTAAPRYELRETASSSTESLNIRERNCFMAGDKFVAIISDAASTGISLHADLRAKNQRRRIHITAELPWSADKAVQQLGRSHRSNQSSGPIYKLITTNLGGERRFAASVARRLQSLGALTKGDRRAATGADLQQFNFDTMYGKQALRSMYNSICKNTLPGGISFRSICPDEAIDLSEFYLDMRECLMSMDILESNTVAPAIGEKDINDIPKFLNRILGLEVKQQNKIFSFFVQCLHSVTLAAKREGRFNEGVTDIRANSITVEAEAKVVFDSARRGTNMQTRHMTLKVDRGVPWEGALSKLNNCPGKFNGFYCSKKEQKGRRLQLLAIQKDTSSHLFIITRPNTGQSPFEEDKVDLLRKYNHITIEEAEKAWTDQYDRTEFECIHGSNCKSRPMCTVGCRTTSLHLLCGRIIALLSVLELTVVKFAQVLGLSRENQTLRVVRVELNDGERLVGLRYAEPLIEEAEKILRDSKHLINGEDNETVVTSDPVIEQISSVVQKCQKKAFTPPITLKNFFKAKPFSFEDKTTTVDSDKSSRTISMKNVASTKTSKVSKRTAANEGSKVKCTDQKRQKQSNIMSSFTQKQNKPKSIISCPICNHLFDDDTNNININIHIDSCIIE